MYIGAEHRPTETNMIPGTGSNPQLTFLPQLGENGYMGNEVASEFIFDQGIYYPAADYYGYYCTGFEPPGEWDDHNRFFGIDGQDVHYSGSQTESFPYVYYTPNYGYAQSSYNPYNPYIPGAVTALDSPYIGTQQYFTAPQYQPPVSSPAYIPVLVQPSTDVVPNSSQDPSLFSTGASLSSRPVNTGVKYTPPFASSIAASSSQRASSGNPISQTSQTSQVRAELSEGSLVNAPPSKEASQGIMSLGSATHVSQVRNSSGSTQVTHHLSNGIIPSVQTPLKVTEASNGGFSHFGSNVRGWAPADKFRPQLQFNGVANNLTGGANVLGEQNKGPRTSRSKGQWTSAFVNGAYSTKEGASDAQRSIVINADQYNRDDFPTNYPNAKFFVIKSYSEDDVHKSIKYNIWSSTPNGNKRLDTAYEDARRISLGNLRNCPIFLFFSVNASGQFCGVAEMIGPVDFHKDMDFWQQDKWTGSFPVKWHIIKDVPNTSFRHIILENNENKPVTNSRDTQEILYLPGMNMLNIFKSSPLKTSILDDLMFYEEREMIMQGEKSRLLGRIHNSYHFLPAVVPVNSMVGKFNNEPPLKPANPTPTADGNQPNVSLVDRHLESGDEPPNGTAELPQKPDGNPQNDAVDQPPTGDTVEPPRKPDGNPRNDAVDRPPTSDGRVDQPPKTDGIPSELKDPKSKGDSRKSDRNRSKPKDPKITGDQPLKLDKKDPNNKGDQHREADRNPGEPKDLKSTAGEAGPADELVTRKMSDDKKGVKPGPKGGASGGDPDATSSSEVMVESSPAADVVTVGSMRIMVKGLGESSSRVIY